MPLMGFREYARHRGCTLRAVQKAIESKRVATVDEAGRLKIDSELADRSWTENTDPAKQSLFNPAWPAPGVPGQATTSADDVEHETADDSTAGYRESRATVEALRAERLQIELDQLKGKLIDVSEAKRIAFTAFRTLRDNILNVPSRIKDEVAAEADAIKVEQLIEVELVNILQHFDPAKALKEQDDDEEDT